MSNSDMGKFVSDKMELDEVDVVFDGSRERPIEGGVGGSVQKMGEATAKDEMLAYQLAAAEEAQHQIDSQTLPMQSKTNTAASPTHSSQSSTSAISEIDETRFPHTEYFRRAAGKCPLEVSWDLSVRAVEVPADADTRFTVRRIVAKVAIERGHEIAWITKVHLAPRYTNSVVPGGGSETRRLYYAEHIEASFGYMVEDGEEDETAASGALPHEKAVIYVGPEEELDLDRIGLWRKSGGPEVVWDLGKMEEEGEVRVV